MQEDKGDVVLQYLPKVVYVQFLNPDGTKCKWKLPGTPDTGIYPVEPTNADWYLDRRRLQPKLKIKRRQLPLAPGFAMTANASQGQTLNAAVVDLRVSKEASCITGYVALSRVKKKEDIVLVRSFDRDMFSKPPLLSPLLLLKHLRGEYIDWKRLRRLVGKNRKGTSEDTEDDVGTSVANGVKTRRTSGGADAESENKLAGAANQKNSDGDKMVGSTKRKSPSNHKSKTRQPVSFVVNGADEHKQSEDTGLAWCAVCAEYVSEHTFVAGPHSRTRRCKAHARRCVVCRRMPPKVTFSPLNAQATDVDCCDACAAEPISKHCGNCGRTKKRWGFNTDMW